MDPRPSPAAPDVDLAAEVDVLRRRVAELERHFGLRFPRDDSDAAVEECGRKVAGLVRTPHLDVAGGGSTVSLINGDNYPALLVLRRYFRRAFDVIYIDPPYNTGNESFFYNDRYLSADAWRHSKWLTFMEHRLRVAAELLAEDGFIFISIDDNEVSHLRLLCDDIFGSSNFVTTFVHIQNNHDLADFNSDTPVPVVGANLGQLKHGHEYLLCYRGGPTARLGLLPPKSPYIEARITNATNRPGQRVTLPAGLRCEAESLDLPVGAVIGTNKDALTVVGDNPLTVRNHRLVASVTLEGRLRNGPTLERFFSGEEVVDRRGQRLLEVFLKADGKPHTRKEKLGELPTSVISGHGDTSRWHALLEEKVGPLEGLMYPKPTTFIEQIIRMGSAKQDALVLDFFAGSATTGEAVLNLNAEDGGRRRCVLVTNDEGGIFTDIAVPRMASVITGVRADGSQADPVPGTLRTFEVRMFDPDDAPTSIMAASAEIALGADVWDVSASADS